MSVWLPLAHSLFDFKIICFFIRVTSLVVVKIVSLLCKSKLGRGRNRMCSVQTDLDCTYTMKRKIDLYSTFFFANKGLDAINMGDILHNKYVRAMFHLISKINLFLSFFIPMLHSLHQQTLIIDVRSSPGCVVVSVLLIILVFSGLFSMFCVLCPILPVCLDCPLGIL